MFRNFLQKYSFQLGTVLTLTLFLYMRLPGLGTDITNSDAVRWHRRTTNFLQALKSGDFKETYQRYHPGVTIMWTNAIIKQGFQSYDSSLAVPQGITIENSAFYPQIHQYSKTLQVFLLTVLLGCQLFLINILYGRRITLFYALVLAIEPYMVGIDRWFHLTSLETYLAFTSLLSLLVWKKSYSSKFLFLSAFTLALAILSKVGVLVILPVFLSIFLDSCRCESYVTVGKKALGFFALLCLFIFLLFPALWVDPYYVFQKILNGIVGGISEDVRFNPFTGWLAYFYYVVVFVMKLSPLTLIIFPLALLKRFKEVSDKKYIFLYFLLYCVSLAISDK